MPPLRFLCACEYIFCTVYIIALYILVLVTRWWVPSDLREMSPSLLPVAGNAIICHLPWQPTVGLAHPEFHIFSLRKLFETESRKESRMWEIGHSLSSRNDHKQRLKNYRIMPPWTMSYIGLWWISDYLTFCYLILGYLTLSEACSQGWRVFEMEDVTTTVLQLLIQKCCSDHR